jgi:hypothetical protein
LFDLEAGRHLELRPRRAVHDAGIVRHRFSRIRGGKIIHRDFVPHARRVVSPIGVDGGFAGDCFRFGRELLL